MRNPMHLFASLFIVFVSISSAAAAEPQLYETGPTEESSYVRFVNATDSSLVITSSGKNINLNAREDGRASHFFTIKAGLKLSATAQINGRKMAIDVVGKPWEYISVVILPKDTSQTKIAIIRETPTDFNAMRASLALFNLDSTCGGAVMQGGAKNVSILDNVKPFSVQRRLVNPVKLSVKVGCGTQGVAIDMNQLEAGGRYSVFLMAPEKAQRTFFVRDSN